MQAIKGFDKDLKCRGFQFEVGKTYTHEGPIEICKRGFHAIPEGVNPLVLLEYYPAGTSRYCRVDVTGEIVSDDEKIVGKTITVLSELSLADLLRASVEFAEAHAQGAMNVATCDYIAASATGECGVASATGYCGAASATGDGGVASATGECGSVSGAVGCVLGAIERGLNGKTLSAATGIVGHGGIKPDTWYTCVGGQLEEVQ